MTTLLSFFSTDPCLVTSPSAECSYNHSTLLCRPSTVFWVFLGDVNYLHYPPRLSVLNVLSALPLVTCPKYCSFIRATFPINSLSRQIFLILTYWYGVLSKKFQASFSSTTSQTTRFYFYPISLMSILPLHTETLPRPSDFITLIFNADVTFLSFQTVVSSTAF